MNTAEQFLAKQSACEADVAVGNLKSFTSPGIDQILAELNRTGWEALRSEIHKIINLLWDKELPH
jgi:hypothetical protein